MRTVVIEANRYLDSVFLMRISSEIERLPGIARVVVSMGTPMNLERLDGAGFDLGAQRSEVGPNDLVVALEADDPSALSSARARLDGLLAGEEPAGENAIDRPVSLDDAVDRDPVANLALISVPGAYAAREARRAIRRGLHAMVFSDNVSIDDEIDLKDEAARRGLLLMGPDCGTALINGAPLGFANVVRRGSIGIVGASGTGIQEVASLIHRLGGGISQAIGTGGRDLSSAIGGRTALFAVDELTADPRTELIIVVSKFPAPAVAGRVIEALRATGKPCVVQFVGADAGDPIGRVLFADTLAAAAILACRRIGLSVPILARLSPPFPPAFPDDQRAVRGFFCGGTLCQEAYYVLQRAGVRARTNAVDRPGARIAPGEPEEGHVLWDLGDDAFTVGRPHPMIEPSLRDERVASAADDPSVAVILVDLVLGHGAHPDPARDLCEAVARAGDRAQARGRDLSIVASVTGTDLDPQDADRQRRLLQGAGVLVAATNADAARWAASIVRPPQGGGP